MLPILAAFVCGWCCAFGAANLVERSWGGAALCFALAAGTALSAVAML